MRPTCILTVSVVLISALTAAAGKPSKTTWGEKVSKLKFGLSVDSTSCRPGERIAVRYWVKSDIGGFRVSRKPASLALSISGPDGVRTQDWWAAYWAKREKPELPWAFYKDTAAFPILLSHLGHVEIVFNPLEVGHRVTFSKPGVYRLRATYSFDGKAVNARRTWAHPAWEGGSVTSGEVTVTVTDTKPNRGKSAAKPERNRKETSQESKTVDRTTLAKDSVHRVQLVVHRPDTLGLEVLGPAGEVRWKTQPSSMNIKVGLHQNRIVIFHKTRNSGRLDLDRPAPTRGATIYTLAGQTIGTLPKSVHDGAFVGGIFLGKMVGRGGVIAFQLDDAKELWRNNNVFFAHWISLAGPGLLNLRRYDDLKHGYTSHVLCLRSGKTLFKISSPRDENVKVLTASKDRYVILRTVMKDPGTACWVSEILDKSGRKTAEIRSSKGMPIQACFSRDGQKLAMIWVGVAVGKGHGVNARQYTLQIYTSQGKQLQETKLLTSDDAHVFEASIIFDPHYVRTTLTRKKNVHIKVSQ